jgi:hypothetical protein
MITTIKSKLENIGTFDINKSLKSITFYAWISAGVLFACYLYFVGAITFSVIQEKGLEQNTRELISSMGQQELQYLSLQKSLTREYAQQSGFVPAERVSFATSQKALAWNVGH